MLDSSAEPTMGQDDNLLDPNTPAVVFTVERTANRGVRVTFLLSTVPPEVLDGANRRLRLHTEATQNGRGSRTDF